MIYNIFNKKKHLAKNIYNIFKIKGLGKDKIKRIRRISLLSFRKFINKEIEIIQKRIKINSFWSNWLKDQLDDLNLNKEEKSMLTN